MYLGSIIVTEKMATGENAGTWGTKTNTNLDIIQQAASGYHSQSISLGGAGANTTALLITDGDSTAVDDALTNAARNTVIKLTGGGSDITGNKIVTFPTDTEGLKVVFNNTVGAYTVQLKGASDSGSGTTFSTTDKGYKLIYMTGTDLVDAGLGSTITLAGTSGSSQTISDGDTLTVAAGNGITTTAGATDTVTVAANPAMTPYITSTGKALVFGF